VCGVNDPSHRESDNAVSIAALKAIVNGLEAAGFERMEAIKEILNERERRVEERHQENTRNFDRLYAAISTQKERIEKVEKKLVWMGGFSAGIGFIGSKVWDWITGGANTPHH